MLLQYFVFSVVGRIIIFFLQKFPFRKLYFVGRLFKEGEFLEQLFSCDLCLGFWIYTFLSVPFKINILQEYFYIFVLSEILTGMFTSFVMHLISAGWKANYTTMVIE